MGGFMKLYVIRHGETDWSVQKRFQGTADISLNEKGVGEFASFALKEYINKYFS